MSLKLAVRSLKRTPLITAAAVVSLALGIGANAAVFSILHQVLLQKLPVPEPDRLVNLSSPGPVEGSVWRGQMGDCECVFSYPMFRDLERVQTVFTGVAAHLNFGANLSYGDRTESVQGLAVSGSYFPVLQLQPALGHLFTPSDDAVADEPHAAVLSYDYWRDRFGSDPAILNKMIVLNGQAMRIIGVAPAGFRGTTVGRERQVFVPITMLRFAWSWFHTLENRRQYGLYLFARLKPGVTAAQAAASINAPYRNIINTVEAPLQQMSENTLARFKAKSIKLDRGAQGQSQLPETTRTPLLLLAGITLFVLLIACSNIANLLLVRGIARAPEMAIRLSIGGSRMHLVRNLLTEACLLALLGGGAGLLVALWTLAGIGSLIPPREALLHYELNSTVLLFAAALTAGTAVLFGLFPAIQSTRPNLLSALKNQTGRQAGARSASGIRTGLTTVQMGLSMALLILAGLFVKSLANLSREGLGLRTEHVVTFRVSPGRNGYTRERTLTLLRSIEGSIERLPGVTAVGGSTIALLAGNDIRSTLSVQGFQSGSDIDSNANYALISPGYFKALEIPLRAGREFAGSDNAQGPKVAIVNEAFTRKFHLGHDAVGKYIAPEGGKLDTEIVGVVQDSKYSGVKEAAPPTYFRPYEQVGESDDPLDVITFYVRSSSGSDGLLNAIRPAVALVDSNVPVMEERTLAEQVQQNISTDRLIMILSSVFAGIATVLAAVGLYGMLAYAVAQRTKEIGVRIALGAAPATIYTMVLLHMGWILIAGGGAGIAAALGGGWLAESILFQLNGHDPAVYGAAAALLTIVALGAGLIPAHRAANVDPMKALRYD